MTHHARSSSNLSKDKSTAEHRIVNIIEIEYFRSVEVFMIIVCRVKRAYF